MQLTKVFDFLQELSCNNNREWFNDHKSDYEEARKEFDTLLRQLIQRISTFDASVQYLEPKDCTYRIYRDIRFSEDKTPYKIHFGGYMNAKGKKSNHGGYYIHLQPGNCMIGGGSLCPPSPLLKAIRTSIFEEIDEYRNIVEAPTFAHLFPLIGMNFLKSAPQGFPKNFPYLKYLQCKEFVIEHPLPDSFFQNKDCVDELAKMCHVMKPFLDFVNRTTDLWEE